MSRAQPPVSPPRSEAAPASPTGATPHRWGIGGTVGSGAALGAARQTLQDLWRGWRLRHRRRYLLLRANRRRRRELTLVQDHSARIGPGDILLFCTFRDEAARLPDFLRHYRALGVRHFFFVDNGSRDGGPALLQGAADVSLWRTEASYKASRFGMDWLNGLLLRHGHDHWCLTVDADELLIYPHWQSRPLAALTERLQAEGRRSFGALMLDLYPQGPVGGSAMPGSSKEPSLEGPDAPASGDPGLPLAGLHWFDAGNYLLQRQPELHNLWIQGGVRARRFFAPDPPRAPTLGKVPLVHWHWRYTYLSSTHSLLPRRLNETYDRAGGEWLSGVLLHTKFLPQIVSRAAEEKRRQEHFANSALYDQYYDALSDNPDLWCPASTRLTGWRQLEALGLMSRGGWL